MRVRLLVLALAVAAVAAVLPFDRASANYGGWHCVAPGETLSGIAMMHGVSVMHIAHANGIVNPNYIRAGQCLVIPGHVVHPGPTHPWPPAQPWPACGYGYHQVIPGQTLFAVGRQYGVSPWSIAAANALPNPHYIRAGQCLYIPRW